MAHLLGQMSVAALDEFREIGRGFGIRIRFVFHFLLKILSVYRNGSGAVKTKKNLLTSSRKIRHCRGNVRRTLVKGSCQKQQTVAKLAGDNEGSRNRIGPGPRKKNGEMLAEF